MRKDLEQKALQLFPLSSGSNTLEKGPSGIDDHQLAQPCLLHSGIGTMRFLCIKACQDQELDTWAFVRQKGGYLSRLLKTGS